ncbi:MAG TPA: YggS family pyridoxal phosphate-dependent enzyme [Smithellaceae bacterium]|nr:YggS family pyridoxal phosphate-dependent enzyme [Smithellaceae bacterium]
MGTDIAANIEKIKQRIAAACSRAGRDPHSVELMAVTKTVSTERILQAVDAGITLLGENYVQEAREKQELLGGRARMHLIGHLQTNKAKYAVRLFDCVHSVDRLELAQELNKRAKAVNRILDILIEVNVSGEQTKNGVSPAQVRELIGRIAGLENLSVRGLMTMAPYSDDPETSRPYFQALRQLRDDIAREEIPRVQMAELSMGMTDDFEVAIEEGSTIVRIGRAIFGARQ